MLYHRATSPVSPSLCSSISLSSISGNSEAAFIFLRFPKWTTDSGLVTCLGPPEEQIHLFRSSLLNPMLDKTGVSNSSKSYRTPSLCSFHWFIIECGIPQPTSSKVHFISKPRGKQKKASALWSISMHKAFRAGSGMWERPPEQLCMLPWPAETACVSQPPRKAGNRPRARFLLLHLAIASPSAKCPHLITQLFL